MIIVSLQDNSLFVNYLLYKHIIVIDNIYNKIVALPTYKH